MILADTSVWVDHLRHDEPILAAALESNQVLMHPFILGELACGNLKHRAEILDLLSKLPFAPVATDLEALAFIENRHLMGRGIGYVDVHLLASVALAGDTRLWTRDRRLAAIAEELAVGFADRP